jgi:hypothetical protein
MVSRLILLQTFPMQQFAGSCCLRLLVREHGVGDLSRVELVGAIGHGLANAVDFVLANLGGCKGLADQGSDTGWTGFEGGAVDGV